MEDQINYLNYPVALAIMVITIGASLFAFSNEKYYNKWMLHPYYVAKGEDVYTYFTSALIHADWMHLIFNMMSYYFFAFGLERQLGHWQFGVLYMASMVLSDIPTVIKHKNNPGYRCLGASGAVSAVIFGYIMFNPTDKMGIMLLPFMMPAWIFGILYLVYCHFASKRGRDHINHDAHLFGAITGVVITVLLHPSVLGEFAGKISGAVQSYLH
jgi:membrane associated rhomboid family serine protease